MAVYSIYFSPTGGTKKVADRLLSAWGEYVEIDLSNYAEDFSRFSFTEEDVCLLAFPVIEGRVPRLVLERLEKMTVCNTPCVLAAVFGNRAINDSLLEMEDSVLPMGFRPFGAVSAVAKHSTLPYAIGRPDAEDTKELDAYSIRLKERWQAGNFSVAVSVPGNRPYWDIPLTPSYPVFDAEKCTKCMICARSCPVQAIDHDDVGLLDTEKCAQCARCTAVCPTGARVWDPKRNKMMIEKRSFLFTERKPNTLYL